MTSEKSRDDKMFIRPTFLQPVDTEVMIDPVSFVSSGDVDYDGDSR
jgi:hypothetical protein